MHESKQNQANAKSKINSQARDELQAEESFLHQEDSLTQQLSGLGNIPNASIQAQMLSRIPASQIAANPQILLQMQQQFGNSHVSQVVQMARESSGQTSQQPVIQAKLKIGAPGDKYEQQADRVASEVVQRIHAPDVRHKTKEETLQPKLMVQGKADGEMTASPELASSIQESRGSGQPLAENIREPMEQAFGTDFSGVRIHTDKKSDELNRSIQAKAFTTGQDVFVQRGEYQPQSKEGQELIAHELTHVVQQNSSTVQRHYIQRDDRVEDESKMESLYQRKYKKNGSRSIFLTDKNGNLKTNRNGNPKTKKLVGGNKLQVIKSVRNPTDLPEGDYLLIKFGEVEVDQTEADTLSINWVYGYAKQSEVKALGEYQDITAIGFNTENPKQGKVLPEQDTDPPISQTDVYQAAISDCYLQAALVAIVNADPRLITALFTRRGVNDLDITFPGYGATDPLKVTLKKKLFLNPEGEPLYGGKKDSYLWAAFIQKAWAIYKGKYSDLPMGVPLQIMGMITGKSTNVSFIAHSEDKKADKVWEIYTEITQALANDKPIIIGTNRWTDVKSKLFGRSKRVMPSKSEHGGLGIAHDYAILGISDANQERPGENQSTLPTNITLTLRDPRTKSGETFELPLESLLDARKVNYVFIGG